MATVSEAGVQVSPTSTSARTTTRIFLSQSLSFHRRVSVPSPDGRDGPPLPQNAKGPLGLTTLYAPSPDTPVVADIVFVHGLNGGSQSTWSKDNKPSNFWPREWLPKDPAFQDARIHSFGYPSALSRESILNVTDFARSLLAAVNDSPATNSGRTGSGSQPRLIFVAHSMGGLVVKKACILSHQETEFRSIAERVCAIFFLATPHQGAAIAQTLARLVALVGVVGARPFVDDLLPESAAILSINEDFPQVSEQIQLMSFFETRPMSIGLNKILIVEKTSAVMNLAHERTTFLDADHRNVAMYSSPDDPSYTTVRNALAMVMSSHRDSSVQRKSLTEREDRTALSDFLSISDAPEDDIMTQDAARLPGSCQWLVNKDYYQDWTRGMESKLLWLRGRPGTGKSVLAGHVVNDLRDQGLDCCFFFFQTGDQSGSTTNTFLRSMAWQMAILHTEVMDTMKELMVEGPVDDINPNPVWRKVYLTGALKVRLNKPQFWVIDSIDECEGSADVMRFIARIQEHWPVSLLVTSRDSLEVHHIDNAASHVNIQTRVISNQDGAQDIALFLKANLERLPCPASAKWPTRWAIASHIIEKSEGCFLWASLICSELRQVTSESEIDMVLDSTPSNMDVVYSKILADMGTSRFGKETAKALITWTTYAFRPLSTSEIQKAIEMDINDKIDDVERTISKCCGSLVFVNAHDRVQLVHATAREFLTRSDAYYEFTETKAEGHRRLAFVCLKHHLHFNTKSPSKTPRPSRLSKSDRVIIQQKHGKGSLPAPHDENPFTEYASKYLFRHISRVSPTDEEILFVLSDFLSSSSFLHWVEWTSRNNSLYTLYHAGKTINNFLERRSHLLPPLSLVQTNLKLALLDRWGNDLIHLATKFSSRLKQNPSSIHHIVPSFCPPNSAIYRQFSKKPHRGLRVQGLSALDWDDCLATITYPAGGKPNALAAGPGYFAVGMMGIQGMIVVYDDAMCQEKHTLEHGEPVWRLAFAEYNGNLMASAGAKMVKVWLLKDDVGGKQAASFRIPSRSLALAFGLDDTVLRVATKQNQLFEWSDDYWRQMEGKRVEGDSGGEETDCWKVKGARTVSWATDLEEKMQGREPVLACFGSAVNLMAVLYLGQDILFWDCIEDLVHDVYEKNTGSVEIFGSHKIAEGAMSTPVRAVTFSDGLDTNLFAATYADGDLVVYNTESGEAVATAIAANALILATSRDGRTLAGVDSKGNVTLFEFETLRPLYRVRFDTQVILPKALAFTADSRRFIEIRGHECRVWEPTVLLRSDITADEEITDTLSMSTGLQEIDLQTASQKAPDITAITCCLKSSVVFYGTENGEVHAYDIAGREPERQLLFNQSTGCGIHLLYFDEPSSMLACGDRAGRVTIRKTNRVASRNGTISWQTILVSILNMNTGEDKVSAPLKQVLVSGNQGRLLISTEIDDILWPMPQNSEDAWITRVKADDKERSGSRWMPHPDGKLLIGIQSLEGQQAISIYRWSSLELVRSIPVVHPMPAGIELDELIPLQNQQLFATYSKPPSSSWETKAWISGIKNPGSGNCIHLWDLSTVTEDAATTQISPLAHEIDLLSSEIEVVIGAFGSRIVLYMSDHWIASVDISPRPFAGVLSATPLDDSHQSHGSAAAAVPIGNHGSFVRHFYLPNDWTGSNISSNGRRPLFGVGRAGEIVLARRSDLAVVKRGLEVTESGASFNPRGGSSSAVAGNTRSGTGSGCAATPARIPV